MSQSLAQIDVHIIFSTKGRRPFLADRAIRDEMNRVLGGICNDLGSPVLIVGGVPDHVHILCRLGKSSSPANLIKELKRQSCLWVKTKGPPFADFHWQTGYGAFSVSPSHVEALREYIAKQEEHHRKVSFKEELIAFLKKHEIAYDEKYLWE